MPVVVARDRYVLMPHGSIAHIEDLIQKAIIKSSDNTFEIPMKTRNKISRYILKHGLFVPNYPFGTTHYDRMHFTVDGSDRMLLERSDA